MDKDRTDLVKSPLYVYNLPEELLTSLKQKDQHPSTDDEVLTEERSEPQLTADQVSERISASCNLCHVVFDDYMDQRRHIQSDWHGYNLKQKMNGLDSVNEAEFERLLENLDVSISGSETSSSEDEDVQRKDIASNSAALAGGDADGGVTSNRHVGLVSRKQVGAAPIVWFSSTLLQPSFSLGIYKALFSRTELGGTISAETIRKKQLTAVLSDRHNKENKHVGVKGNSAGPNVFLCMIGGGHFAGMVVSLTSKTIKDASGLEKRQASVIAHKTFHRYTTRRKQGGSQSANDASKGNAHSAGAGIRRHNEAALESEVRALLAEWKELIQDCELLFVRATGRTNKRTLFGPYNSQILRSDDTRMRSFPFSTRRATQSELMRAFVELTRVKVRENMEVPKQTPEKAPAARNISAKVDHKNAAKKPEPLDQKAEEAALHTAQLQALIRRSKAPAVISYLDTNSVSPNFSFYPPTNPANHHAPTPLHLASSTNSAAVVSALLVKAGADPTLSSVEGKVPFDVAGGRATRDAFRIARSELGEGAWDWQKAHCPPAITKVEADQREKDERAEARKVEEARREAEKVRLDQTEQSSGANPRASTGRSLNSQDMSAEDRREVESRGMTAEQRTKLERERRARAAEARMKRTNNT